ncbi:MAG: glutamate synthase subunit alpha, partial [Rhodocyclaceae bacterium UTPRO2]
MERPQQEGLYDPSNEHDACGVGFVVNIKNRKSHAIVEQGLQILKNLEHRGATGYDPLLGDGAGILIQIPGAFFREEMAKQGISLPPAGEYGVGMIFLPRNSESRRACEAAIERTVRYEGQTLLGWRDVPCDNAGLAQAAKDCEPVIRQVFIGRGAGLRDQDAFERKLYVIRKEAGHRVQALKLPDGKMFYVPSLSTRTLVYKGMLLADQVGQYFLDLQDPRMVSALALVHQRFSTNTFPTWDLAHPFRMIAHNGEINTLRGNVNWIRARENDISSPLFGEDLEKIWPLIYDGQSDSASFDNALELLVMGGYSLAHAMMLLIPEAWAGNPLMDEDRRAFYEYHMALMEPWDGPAAVAFTDGRQIGATLDRNGLRPARYLVTDDDLVVMASEIGVLPIPEERIVKKWRLQPGRMLLIDLEEGRIVDDEEVKHALAQSKPYRAWLERSRHYVDELPEVASPDRLSVPLLDLQQAFGYTQEDLKFILEPMATNGEEATGSMGNDAALPVLSNRNKPLFSYFKQLFAQVTNPPIDPIREEIVMSLISLVSPNPNLLKIDETEPTPRLEVKQPILAPETMAKLKRIAELTGNVFRSKVIDIATSADEGPVGLSRALYQVCVSAERAVGQGSNVIILSDRGVDAGRAAIPSLLACSAVH